MSSALWAARGASVEELDVMTSEAAPRSLAWHLELPEGARVEKKQDELWVFGQTNALLLHVAAPFTIDAEGARRTAHLEWNAVSATLTISLDESAHYTYPVLLDPVLEAEAWDVLEHIEGRITPDMIYDETRKELVVFGGFSQQGYEMTTWTWNGSWHKRATLNAPALRIQPCFAYDAIRKVGILVGGMSTSGVGLNDTWAWDGTDWKLLAPAHKPPRVYGARAAFDSVSGKIVMFGGSDLLTGAYSNVTSTWNGTDWTNETPAHVPPGRLEHGVGLADAGRHAEKHLESAAGVFLRELEEVRGGAGFGRKVPDSRCLIV